MPKPTRPPKPIDKKKSPGESHSPKNRIADQEPVAETVHRPYWSGYRVMAPKLTRFSEATSWKNIESFYEHPYFRRDIDRLRKRYPITFWTQLNKWQSKASLLSNKAKQHFFKMATWRALGNNSHFFLIRPPHVEVAVDADIEALCSDWCLFYLQDRQWIKWLIQKWDTYLPDSHPPKMPEDCKPILHSWTNTITFGMKPKGKGSVPIQAKVIFRPGISKKEAHKIAREAVEQLEAPPVLSGRPSLSRKELVRISELIKAFHSPKARNRSKTVQKILETMKSDGLATSKSAIDNKYRQWLRKNEISIKTYHREPHKPKPPLRN